jgi:hypothetical protein
MPGAIDPKITAERIRLHSKGYTDGQIAQMEGVSNALINSWRRRVGLPVNSVTPETRVRYTRPLRRRSPDYETTEHERQIVRECIGKLMAITKGSKRRVTVAGISNYFELWREEYGGDK